MFHYHILIKHYILQFSTIISSTFLMYRIIYTIIIILIMRNLYCATKCSEQTQHRMPMHNGYVTHDQDLMTHCRAFPLVRQGTILNTIESSALLPMSQQCYLRLWSAQNFVKAVVGLPNVLKRHTQENVNRACKQNF